MNTTAELTAALKKMNKGRIVEYTAEQFEADALKYIAAIRDGRMINAIGSVSRSGMSRTMKFMSCEVGDGRTYFRNYIGLFKALGYKEAKEHGYFTIGGCGMDMVFHTNYTNIHRFHRLGLISKEECDTLAQQTPTTI